MIARLFAALGLAMIAVNGIAPTISFSRLLSTSALLLLSTLYLIKGYDDARKPK